MNHSRRSFLAAAGAVSASALAASCTTIESSLGKSAAPGRFGRPLRRAYDLDPRITYFNHASIGTVPTVVRETQCRNLALCESNPWLYVWGGKWDDDLDRARADLAAFMGCDAEELAIVRTTTEAMNILAAGLDLEPRDEVLFGSENHIGASACFDHWSKRRGYTVRRFPFPLLDAPGTTPDDIVSLYESQISDKTRLLVLPHVDNMVGLRHPVEAIIRMARTKGVEWIAVDGAQAVGMIDAHMHTLDVDFYATSTHKWLQSPKGFGALFVKRSLLDRVEPMIVTWGQARWGGSARKLEDFGTRDPSSLLALGEASRFQRDLNPRQLIPYRQSLRAHCQKRVDASPNLIWRSPRHEDLATPIVAVEVKGQPSTEVFKRMNTTQGFVFRPFSDHGLNTMRLSFNAMNDTAEIDRFFEALAV